jgi:hypothetical protein
MIKAEPIHPTLSKLGWIIACQFLQGPGQTLNHPGYIVATEFSATCLAPTVHDMCNKLIPPTLVAFF